MGVPGQDGRAQVRWATVPAGQHGPGTRRAGLDIPSTGCPCPRRPAPRRRGCPGRRVLVTANAGWWPQMNGTSQARLIGRALLDTQGRAVWIDVHRALEDERQACGGPEHHPVDVTARPRPSAPSRPRHGRAAVSPTLRRHRPRWGTAPASHRGTRRASRGWVAPSVAERLAGSGASHSPWNRTLSVARPGRCAGCPHPVGVDTYQQALRAQLDHACSPLAPPRRERRVHDGLRLPEVPIRVEQRRRRPAIWAARSSGRSEATTSRKDRPSMRARAHRSYTSSWARARPATGRCPSSVPRP